MNYFPRHNFDAFPNDGLIIISLGSFRQIYLHCVSVLSPTFMYDLIQLITLTSNITSLSVDSFL